MLKKEKFKDLNCFVDFHHFIRFFMLFQDFRILKTVIKNLLTALKVPGYLSTTLLPLEVHVWEGEESHPQDLDRQFSFGGALVPVHQGQLPHLQQRAARGVGLVQRPLQRGERRECLPHALLHSHLFRPPSDACDGPVYQVKNVLLNS